MSLIQTLRREFTHEAQSTRRQLERLPADQLDWRPHAKSFTARGLGSHIVDCIGWTGAIFGGDEIDINPATFTPFVAASLEELLQVFDEKVAAGERLLAAATDHDLAGLWRMKIRGHLRFEKTRAEVLRDFTLSHQIHHRGQLSVYLRLLDVPVPGAYGPTADDKF